MENKNYPIGHRYTDNGKNYEVQPSPNTNCNACRGCGYYETVNSCDDPEGKPLFACSAPIDMTCTAPDRIFVELKTVPA